MSHYPNNLPEEDLKKAVADEWFPQCTFVTQGKVDFCLYPKKQEDGLGMEENPLLWAEAKAGASHDIIESFVQLILTIGRKTAEGRLVDDSPTPPWLGAFDAEKFAFVRFDAVADVFDMNDFNWNATPSDHGSKEFREILALVTTSLHQNQSVYAYDGNEKELKHFITEGILKNRGYRQQITDRNFARIFHQWEARVQPSIDIDWQNARGLLPRDFFLADLLSKDGKGLVENLFVVLNSDQYLRRENGRGYGVEWFEIPYSFKDNQKAYNAFWNIFRRPPQEKFWETIMERVDLLVPRDYRERKGAFFTPEIWVQKSQEYLASVLGENWQDEYYIWDCCAGTGNLEVGLKRPLKVWASTLDEADVKIMRQLCRQGENYAREHLFQFDFLNGDFSKLPESLRKVLDDQEKRRKLVIFINPPYAEHGNAKQASGNGKNKSKVATETAIYKKAKPVIGAGARELFVQFLFRIHTEIPGCIIGNFSTLKPLNAQNFAKFRQVFQPKLQRLFIVPANTFDNVAGEFPIGFFIWDGSQKEPFQEIAADVFDAGGVPLGQKLFQNPSKLCIDWIKQFYDKAGAPIAFFRTNGSDMQNNNGVFLTLKLSANDEKQKFFMLVTRQNILPFCVYFTARHCIEHTWLNDRDQYLWPDDGWRRDREFQNDCLAYTIFHGSNNIRSTDGINHWIPFTEEEVGAVEEFASHFMQDFIGGQWVPPKEAIFVQEELDFGNPLMTADCPPVEYDTVIVFSAEAKAVLDAGRELWRYYHSRNGNGFKDDFPYCVDASFYDIREHFQGRKKKKDGSWGDMNTDSPDAEYTRLVGELRERMKTLGEKLAGKIRRYGFLLE